MRYSKSLSSADQAKLDQLYTYLKNEEKHLSGYPCNCIFDYSELYRFLQFPLNNIGDPFQSSPIWRINSHSFELEVLKFFADILHAPSTFHGYMTSGGTEGNLYGMNIAKSLYPHGCFYVSEAAHYSIFKILHILNFDHKIIPAQDNGEINCDALEKNLQDNKRPPLLVLNIGTTMKGAMDNVEHIRNILKKLQINQFYLHADAALSGAFLPFIANTPHFDFKAGIHSIAISGHKFIGSPIPCGIALTDRNYVTGKQFNVEYVHVMDTTITGSRNGITPLFMWYAIKRMGKQGFSDCIQICLANAEYAVKQLQAAGIPAWRNPHSITVLFPRPSDAIIKKWFMAPEKDLAHIITNPHVSRVMIDDICRDLAEYFR